MATVGVEFNYCHFVLYCRRVALNGRKLRVYCLFFLREGVSGIALNESPLYIFFSAYLLHYIQAVSFPCLGVCNNGTAMTYLGPLS